MPSKRSQHLRYNPLYEDLSTGKCIRLSCVEIDILIQNKRNLCTCLYVNIFSHIELSTSFSTSYRWPQLFSYQCWYETILANINTKRVLSTNIYSYQRCALSMSLWAHQMEHRTERVYNFIIAYCDKLEYSNKRISIGINGDWNVLHCVRWWIDVAWHMPLYLHWIPLTASTH